MHFCDVRPRRCARAPPGKDMCALSTQTDNRSITKFSHATCATLVKQERERAPPHATQARAPHRSLIDAGRLSEAPDRAPHRRTGGGAALRQKSGVSSRGPPTRTRAGARARAHVRELPRATRDRLRAATARPDAHRRAPNGVAAAERASVLRARGRGAVRAPRDHRRSSSSGARERAPETVVTPRSSSRAYGGSRRTARRTCQRCRPAHAAAAAVSAQQQPSHDGKRRAAACPEHPPPCGYACPAQRNTRRQARAPRQKTHTPTTTHAPARRRCTIGPCLRTQNAGWSRDESHVTSVITSKATNHRPPCPSLAGRSWVRGARVCRDGAIFVRAWLTQCTCDKRWWVPCSALDTDGEAPEGHEGGPD